jgi:DNA-binding NtrC family response regulator
MAVSPRPSAIPRTAAPGRILLVDDDKNILTAYARILAKEGHTVVSAGAATEALARFAEGTFDAVLSDVMMPGLNGLALLAALRERAPLVPVIFITAAPTIDTAAQAVAGGAHLYLMKPIEAVKLREVVADAVWKGQVARRERDALETAERAERAARAQDAGLEGAFQRALETMTIAYQPIVSWPTRTTLAYEALMRSKEPLLPHPGAGTCAG